MATPAELSLRFQRRHCDPQILLLQPRRFGAGTVEIPINQAGFARWLQEPPVKGWLALVCGMAAVWLPTVVRAAVNGVVTGCEFTPYLPFVLICAILLRWWQAAIVALVSVAILGGMFQGSMPHVMPCFIPAASIFLGASAVMIGIIVLIRRAARAIESRAVEEPSSAGLRFSLDRGEVWASWYGNGRPVRLGSQRNVAEVMEDFLAQESGKRSS